MMRKIIIFLIIIPFSIGLITLAVANRSVVTLVLNPFSNADSAYSFKLPLFIMLLFCLMLGVLLGGISMWLAQSRHRKNAKALSKEVDRLKANSVNSQPKSTTIALPTHITLSDS